MILIWWPDRYFERIRDRFGRISVLVGVAFCWVDSGSAGSGSCDIRWRWDGGVARVVARRGVPLGFT